MGEIREVLQDIVEADERAVSVIQRLRDLLKKGDRRAEQIDINGLVGSTLALLRGELARRGVEVDVNLARTAPAAFGDPVQLQQVILNLLMNAADAMASTPAGGRAITVSTGVTPTRAIQIDVRDTGPGIGPTDHGRLFEPFYSTKADGLGLGLTISSTIAQSHGGTLTLADGEGCGAVATLVLPAVPVSTSDRQRVAQTRLS